ncbi:Pleckstrin homology domain-containing protein [Cyathus striatus]|nr:Pleckstrin homology domain-containing protein [Cyathus striatus]
MSNVSQTQDGTIPITPATTHVIRRIFIGPMPEKILTYTEQQAPKHKAASSIISSHHGGQEDDMDTKMKHIFKDHAYRFFLKQGGRPQDWGEEEERSTVRDMLERWKVSEWGQLLTHRNHKKNTYQPSQWVGESFEVGSFLGINVLEGEQCHHSSSGLPKTENLKHQPPPPSTTGMESFITVPSHPVTLLTHKNGHVTDERVSVAAVSTPATSRTALLGPDHLADTSVAMGSASSRPLKKASVTIQNLGSVKGKGRAMPDAPQDNTLDSAEEPAPSEPTKVLERTPGLNLPNNTSAAAEHSVSISPVISSVSGWGDVVLRDRMLVRVVYTKLETLSPAFDDSMNRTTRDLHYEAWGEFLVAWRKDNIEIYEDHSIPGKEWITRRKHLSYVIPLKSSRTRLSLYSWADLTFCITCPPTTRRLNQTASRWIFSRDKEGTNIFVFKVKSRSRAYDWTWQLWRHMGGRIPTSIDIQNPTLSTKVKIDIPDSSVADMQEVLTRKGVLDLCMNLLQQVRDWKSLVEREIVKGRPLQLCWRVGANLDWIWLDQDVNGNDRPWVILCGLAFRHSAKPPTLEIRLADHCSSHIFLKSGHRVDQPPEIEGYVDRIRPNTQTKQPLYLAVHDGNLFTLYPSVAKPPSPPSLILKMGEFNEYLYSLRHTEIQRGSMQIMNATGVCDLRSIAAVRRAFQVTPPHTHDHREVSSDNEAAWFATWSTQDATTVGDDEDAGGEDAFNAAEDKVRLKMRRSFELLLISGNVIRFEAHSCHAANEWIHRLRALILYWKARHRVDAKEEVELAQAVRSRLTPQVRACQGEHETAPLPPPDLSAPFPAMNNLFNWCTIGRCKSIVKGGKLYVRKGLRGQYKLVQMFLVNGHLIQFQIKPQSSLHTAKRKKISLMDAYVCSGYFAAIALPKGQYSPNAPPPARRYQDGLEADDRDEDMLFMIWYRPQTIIFNNKSDLQANISAPVVSKSVPNLSTKFKLLVCRTRSKLERDSWCWALNCEIEQIVREQKDREQKLREMGNLYVLS